MGILVALTVGLVFWVAGWAFGIKAFDAFLVTVALASRRRLSTPRGAVARPARGRASEGQSPACFPAFIG